ncbi:MAG TPA: signal peptidase I [Armatimonadota bacterium]|nr:signal peptidase I [Armatimonadota bacterium]
MTAGAVVVATAGLSPVRLGMVSGSSMEPTLRPGQLFLYDRHAPQPATLQAGELVLVRLNGETCLKRVFALGGERFWAVCRRGHSASVMTRPGRCASVERLRKRFPRMVYRERRVPFGMLFVVGDSPTSYDSRQLGPVPLADVQGRVVAGPTAAPPPYALGWTAPPQPPHLPRKLARARPLAHSRLP